MVVVDACVIRYVCLLCVNLEQHKALQKKPRTSARTTGSPPRLLGSVVGSNRWCLGGTGP